MKTEWPTPNESGDAPEQEQPTPLAWTNAGEQPDLEMFKPKKRPALRGQGEAMTHAEMCDRAAMWLRSTGRCKPVLTRIGSCAEVPDAIGWNSRGSIVVECKTSRADFMADKKKYIELYREKKLESDLSWQSNWGRRYRLSKQRADFVKMLREEGYIERPIAAMGERRYFLCEPEIISERTLLDQRPDHGLLHLCGTRIREIVEAPLRNGFDFSSEIRYLRFAVIHIEKNLLNRGCRVNLQELTKFFGAAGVELPSEVI